MPSSGSRTSATVVRRPAAACGCGATRLEGDAARCVVTLVERAAAECVVALVAGTAAPVGVWRPAPQAEIAIAMNVAVAVATQECGLRRVCVPGFTPGHAIEGLSCRTQVSRGVNGTARALARG